MLTGSKRISTIGDRDTFWILTLEIAGARFYFGDESRHITNRSGTPTVISVHGCDLVESFSRAFDIATDLSADTSVSISDLKVPVRLPTAFRAGENMVGNRAELALLRVGQDYGQRWVQAAGTLENPTLMSTESAEDCISFSINQEDRQQYDFPTEDYLVQPGWLEGDEITVAADPEAAFGLDPGTNLAGVSWSGTNFLWSTADVVLTLPAEYTDRPAYVPFVFGRPGISGGTDDVELWKDLDHDGVIDDAGSFSVGLDERLRYFTTYGQVVAALTLGHTTVDDPDADDVGTTVLSIMDDFGLDSSGSVDVHLSGLEAGATYTFSHADACLWARVAIHAGKAAQVGSSIYMVDRDKYGTPYSRSGSYTATLGYTARGRPYTYVDIKADYSAYLTIINPAKKYDTDAGFGGQQVYIHVVDGSHWSFKFFGEQIGGTLGDVTDALLLWEYAFCCWLGALRSGNNTAEFMQAFFTNAEVQRVIEGSSSSTWQDKQLSAFNLAMGARLVIKYPTADPLDAHCPGNWTEGGQTLLDGAVIENPAELVMHMAETTGLVYDKGSLFELRDAMRGWKIGGVIDDVTDVVDYITGVLQTYCPFTIAKSADGITAIYWKWDALRTDAVHHFVEGVDFEIVGDGLQVDEAGMLRSLRLLGRPVTWLHQEEQPFGTFKPVEDSQLTAKQLKRLTRLRNNVRSTSHPHSGRGKERALAKFEKHLRSTYGSWDFAQDSRITEQQDFWRINNYTGDVEAAAIGQWKENPLTFPVEDYEREQWSRYMPHPLLVAAFRRYANQDRDDLVLELEDVHDVGTLNRSADWIIAARSQPKITGQGIAGKRFGWIVEGDPIRVTSPTLGLEDAVALVVEKGWQQTNALFRFRTIRLPARDTIPTPAAGPIIVDEDVEAPPDVFLEFEVPTEIGSGGIAINTGTLTLPAPIVCTSDVTRDTGVFVEGVASAHCHGGSYMHTSLSGSPLMDFINGKIRFFFRPASATGTEVLFEWSKDINNRLIIYLIDRVPQVYIIRSGVTSGTIASSHGAVTQNAWSLLEWEVASGIVALRIADNSTDEADLVACGTCTAGGSFTRAQFGDPIAWGSVAYTPFGEFQGWIDSFKLWALS